MTQPLRSYARALVCVFVCAACDTDPAPGAPDIEGASPREPSVGAAQRGGDRDDDNGLDAGAKADASTPPPPKTDAGGLDATSGADGSFGAFNDASLGLLDGGTLTPGFTEAGSAEAGLGEAGPNDGSAEGG